LKKPAEGGKKADPLYPKSRKVREAEHVFAKYADDEEEGGKARKERYSK
jgi:hypothetical protein